MTKHIICPYCGKIMYDDRNSFRFRCQYCKEYLIDIDKDHCRPETYWKEEQKMKDPKRINKECR